MTAPTYRLFVSSPGDVAPERQRTAQVVERLNGEFAGRVRIETVLWEEQIYSAHAGFQDQITEAAECDIVVAIFRARLGQPLPETFPRHRDGQPYASGTAYEVLTAIEARRAGNELPDIYVFRYPNNPTPGLDDPNRREIEVQWGRLKAFMETWFRGPGGEFLAAFQDYASTDDFADQVERCLRQFLARRGFDAKSTSWDHLRLGSPFPGLAAFGPALAPVFFGRDLAISQAVTRLRQAGAEPGRSPFLLIIGASGSGKSSLLRAGLLPRLVLPGTIPEIDLWRTVLITPGTDPFLTLAERLLDEATLGAELREGAFHSAALLARQLAAEPDLALAPIRTALVMAAERRRSQTHAEAPRPARILLAIDQAERLFMEAAPDIAGTFARLVATLVDQDLAYAVVALRSDAYDRFQASAPLLSMREKGATFDLVPPNAAELEEMITRPVQACDPPLAFKAGESLAIRLAQDSRGGDALPLLQMTLSRLYDAEAARKDGVLRAADYRGMDAAVTETAAEALATLPPDARDALPALLSGLISDIGTDPRTGIALPVATALDHHAFTAGHPARAALIEAFVARRLLTSEGVGAKTLVRPTHEAVLRIWPDAVAIIAELGPLLRVRHALEPLVREWQGARAAEQPGHLELSPALLAGAQLLAARLDIPPGMAAFIAACAEAATARERRETQEQARRLRDAEALAAARRRVARRTTAGLVAALLLAVAAGWQWRQAGMERDKAEQALGAATQAANTLVFDLAQSFRDRQGIPVDIIRRILDQARQLQDRLIQQGKPSPALRRSQAAALSELVTTLLAQGQTANALTAARQSHEVFQFLSEEAPASVEYRRSVSNSISKVGDVLVAQGDRVGALAAYRAGMDISARLAATDPGNAGWQRDLSVSHNNVGDMLVAQGDRVGALAAYRASTDISARLTAADPGNAEWQRDLSVSHSRIGDVLVAQGDRLGALAAYRASMDISARLAAADPGNAGWQRDLSVSHGRIGNVLVAQGDRGGALAAYRASMDISARLAAADPGNAEWQRNLSLSHDRTGDVLVAQGDRGGALAAYRASMEIKARLAAADSGNAQWQRDLSVSHDRIGNVLVAQGDRVGAVAAYRAGMELNARLAAADPGNAGWQRDLSVSHSKIGNVLVAQGDRVGALAAYRAGMAIRARLAGADPGNAGWQRDLSISHSRIGDVLVAQGDRVGALAAYRAGIEIRARLAAADPGNAEWQRDLSISHNKIGDMLVAQGDRVGALAAYRAGMDISGRLAASDPGNAGWQRDLSVSHIKVGDVLVTQGDRGGALASYRASMEIRACLAATDPGNAGWQRDLSVSHDRIGNVLVAQGDRGGALAAYRASMEVRARLVATDRGNAGWQRDLFVSHTKIGDVLVAQGDRGDALAAYRAGMDISTRLIVADPGNAGWQRDLSISHSRIGDVLVPQGDRGGALAAYRAGMEISARLAAADPGNAEWQRDLIVSYVKLADVYFLEKQYFEAQGALTVARTTLVNLMNGSTDNSQFTEDLAEVDYKLGRIPPPEPPPSRP